MIDLRSDTVTQPTQAMRDAMSQALVGDDVYGDDMTTIDLERIAAHMLGKEAALLVPSGTFGNQLALLTHTRRGDEVICGEDAHVIVHEVGAAAVIAGVQLRTIPTYLGRLDLEATKRAIRAQDIHYPNTGLICMENAHGCGAVLPLDHMQQVFQLAQEHGIPLHLDGARIFNAATALNTTVDEIAKYCDTVNVCLSKGLCAPIGSILAGSHAFIERARKNRKLMGGGMRQTGMIAAAGIVALQQMPQFLKGDHQRAEHMAKMLDSFDEIEVAFDYRDINMVFFTLPESIIAEEALVKGLKQRGILVNGTEDGLYRFVTHHWITDEHIEQLRLALNELLGRH